MELDLKKTLAALLTRALVIIVATIACGALFFVVSRFFTTPVYTSQTLLHVSNMTERKSSIVTSSDVTVSRELLDTCVVILNSRTVLDKVAEQSGLDYTSSDIKDMISAESVSSTEIFKISVTLPDPREAQIIADAITRVAPSEFKRVLNGGAVSIVDYATLPITPSAPNVFKNTLLGAVLGAILSVVMVLFIEAMDTSVKDETVLEELFDIPIIGMVPSFELLERINHPVLGHKHKKGKKVKKEDK